MKPAREWHTALAGTKVDARYVLADTRDGVPTLSIDGRLLHSRYRPLDEARRLIDSANLDPARPVLVLGAGLGYPALELAARGYSLALLEPDPVVARIAVEGPLRDSEILFHAGSPARLADDQVFRDFCLQLPQLWVHPATAALEPEWTTAMASRAARAALEQQRLRIAVVGPMYGGSLPIASYLDHALQRLGHRTLFMDTSQAWRMHENIRATMRSKRASEQLSQMYVNVISEWCYGSVAEFHPDICIVIAQAPVSPQFPARLRELGIVSAFWYIENWRHLPYWQLVAPQYDYFFHIQPGDFERRLDECGCAHHAVVLTGCDPEIHRPVELSNADRAALECDLSFAGAGYLNRNQLFSGLTDYNFAIYGVDWTERSIQSQVRNPGERFTPEFFAKLVAASKINLNLHSSAVHSGVDPDCDAINPRVFEIAACGGFQLCDPCRGLEDCFDFETELPTYRSLAELRARIDYFLAHPEERAEFAGRARQRALRDHTYDRRAQQMLEMLLEEFGPRILKKGLHVERTASEMVEQVGADSELGRYLSTLDPAVPFTQEGINAQITSARTKLTRPEMIFAYLREMRNYADSLLANPP